MWQFNSREILQSVADLIQLKVRLTLITELETGEGDVQGSLEEMERLGRSSTTIAVFGTGPPSTEYACGRGKAATVYRSTTGQRPFALAPQGSQSSFVFGSMIGFSH